MSKGYVYILINPSLEGLVKIGRTTKSSETRAAEISRGSGVPTAYNVACEEFVSHCDTVEKRLHQMFSSNRVNANREFFRIPLKEAVRALQQVAAEFREPEHSNAVEMVPRLLLKYANYLKPKIRSVKMVHKSGLCFLEITSWIHRSDDTDEQVERIDLGFIGGKGQRDMFNTSRSPSENADLFIAELDPYSIIVCTPLFTDEACKEIADEYESQDA